MIKDHLQDALVALVPENPNWYGWAKVDSDGNKIPNDQRMQTQYVIVNSEHESIVTRPTDDAINAKVQELENAEPMRLLRLERDRKLTETDWEITKALETGSDATALKEYRQALRDLPSTASPSLDENGQLTGVEWPNKPTEENE